ncbi:MAG: cytochrome c oxidase assembly protein [Alphaproteobacteria bacterium]
MAATDRNRNRKTLIACATVVAGMVGLSFASVPLYDLFCRVTGYGGTTQVAASDSATVTERIIRVRFDASTNPHLGWRFEPVQREMTLQVGQTALAYYRATNLESTVNTGTATFNVTPQKAGLYFAKIECFCFTEQQLEPGQSVDMPVTFFIDPEIESDPNLDEVKTITLSYTFFRAATDETDAADKTASVNQTSNKPAEMN